MMRTIRRFAITGALALGGAAGGHYAHAQVNPFNPDYAFCNIQGSLAVRGPLNWQCLTPGSAGQVMVSGGAGAQPGWLTVTGAGTVTSVAASVPSFMAVSGSPVTTAGTLAFSFNSQAQRLFLASPPGASGSPTFRAMVAADMPNAGVHTGDISGTFPATSINNGVVTNAKMANMASLTVKSNVTGAAASPNDNTISAILDASFLNTQGAVLYRGATGWTALAAGNNGEMLTTRGAGQNPAWTPVTGNLGGTVTSVTCGTGLTGGAITVSGTCAVKAGAVPGVTTSVAAAAAGDVGQVIDGQVSRASRVALTSATLNSFATVALTPGDWELSAACQFYHDQDSTRAACSITSSPGGAPISDYAANDAGWPTPTPTGPATTRTLVVAPFRVLVTSNTTFYLTGYNVFNGAAGVYGAVHARRVR